MLTVDHFADFFNEVHGGAVSSGSRRDPFPWQSALLRRVVDRGWPDGIDVPTGLGKTSVLDVAVFAAALGISDARRRIFYVVDRRLIVDEAHEHARRIAAALDQPLGEATRAVARRLRGEDDEVALDVTRMRGGVTWERTWLERPDRYAIVTGTVDQIGSRLLFRGYGVSDRARPIDAALVGTDSLILIDEAHLAQAFVTTAQAAFDLDGSPIARHPIVVTMSATTAAGRRTDTSGRDTVHRISADDERHDIAGERLTAAKRLHLVEVKTTKKTEDTVVPAAMAALADRVAPGRVVGVVTNTVARARAVFELLRDHHDAVLLTGRSRPIDRDCLLATYYPRISVDRDRSHQRPLIVVATQTVEVGANIDLDALITESAPLASLVQRLGRLNRVARSNHGRGIAIVVHGGATGQDDPVYGPARLATWQWLSSKVDPAPYTPRLDPTQPAHWLDASPAALRRLTEQLTAEEQAAMRGVTPYIPVLQRHHLDTWARTAPSPVPDQPIEPFLHGVSDDQPPVAVVWRHGPSASEQWADLVHEMPPVAEETLEVPVAAVRRWLLGAGPDSAASDLDTVVAAADATEVASGQPPRVRQVLRYQGRGDAQLIAPWQVRPGDTIVVPTDVGGCDEYGWHPTSTAPVLDVADLAVRRGRPVLRLGPTLVTASRRWGEHLAALAQQLIDHATEDAAATAVRPAVEPYLLKLKAMRKHAPEGPLRDVLAALLAARPQVTLRPHLDQGGQPYLGLVATQISRLGDDDTSMGSSTAAQPVRLEPHQAAVAARARQFAEALGLPPHVIESVRRAARWHDEGKRDPRFQIMLWDGNRAAADIADQPLAKSGIDPSDRAAFIRARTAARYPDGMRHEALSARIAAARLTGDHHAHPELVVHLVASHHGHARPLLPPIVDPQPAKVTINGLGTFDTANTIDWQQPHRFSTLNDTYGRWGLALLETIVRLADIWCSARHETIEDTP
ncbi:type I-G CRISPR-associated helicase/endonuclease Cas3g [Micromonospora globbae]|uniref:type I-G CRISPR-associated helicase/endonuclease Cas3g n=1 Tax=Micromonospora globbae TaxID=1894969 RepID=UPI00343DE2F1